MRRIMGNPSKRILFSIVLRMVEIVISDRSPFREHDGVQDHLLIAHLIVLNRLNSGNPFSVQQEMISLSILKGYGIPVHEITLRICNTPCQAVVCANNDTGHPWKGCTDYIDSWRV